MRLSDPDKQTKIYSLKKGFVLLFILTSSTLANNNSTSKIAIDLTTLAADSSIHYRWENSGWEPSRKHIYLHDDFGQLTRDSRYSLSIDTWFNERRDILSYDSQNNLVEWLNQEGYVFTWQNFWLDQYEYDDNGALIVIARQIDNTDSWQFLERINYLYNEDSLISEEIIQANVAGNWLNDYHRTYTYLSDGQLAGILCQSWDYDGGIWSNDSLKSNSFTDGKLTQLLVQTWSDGLWINQHQKSFAYDADDRLIEGVGKDWFGGQWLEIERQVHDFDLSGYLMRTTNQDWDYDETSWFDRDRVLFHHDESGKLVESLTQYWDAESNDWALEYLYTWYYPSPSDVEPFQPKRFTLEQNFPNPFNPTTSIRFDIPENSLVNLTIYDVLGIEIITLYNGEKAAGSHELIWSGVKHTGYPVSTGVYFCRLQAGSFNETIKMLYLR